MRRRPGTRLLVVAATVVAVAGVTGVAGLALGTLGLVAVARGRIRELEVQPSQIAKQKWSQAKAATVAGVGAWRHAPAASPARSPSNTSSAFRTPESART
jgi:hypothetical protein